MARQRSARRQQLERAAMYPLDWLEERSGLVGGVRYFLFRKVPGDTNWFHTLGSATLTAFLVQVVTGVILAMYYKPDPNSAHASIDHITHQVTLGWLVRGMHKWGASVFIILMFMHMGRVFLFGAYKYPRELNWIIGVLLLATGLFEGLTGYLLPFDQTAYWATVVAININGTAPFVGPFLASLMRGGARRSSPGGRSELDRRAPRGLPALQAGRQGAREAVLPVRDVPRHGDEPRRGHCDFPPRGHLEVRALRLALSGHGPGAGRRPGDEDLRAAAGLVLLLPLLPAPHLQVA